MVSVEKIKFASLGEIIFSLGGSVAGATLIFSIIKYYLPNKTDKLKAKTIDIDNERKQIINEFLKKFLNENDISNNLDMNEIHFLKEANNRIIESQDILKDLIIKNKIIDVIDLSEKK